VTRLVAQLHEELSDDFLAVWLYGSRARGEASLEEADPDRMSDAALLVVAVFPDRRE
jgi:predicted nucleotidyltransferase